MATERLTFDDLTPHLLLQNGNFLYKVPFRDGWAVLKVYYGSRGFFGRLYKSLANVLGGQTSYLPRTRLKIERECLALWAEHGFRTFGVYDVEVVAPRCPPGGYLLLEYVDEIKLNQYLHDETIDADERRGTFRRWLKEWSRRHDIAIRDREPKLVHENGDGKHVMILDDGSFLWFDFEMVYRSRRKVRWSVAHEVAQYVWEILRSTPEADRERILEEFVQGYPDRGRLYDAHDYFWRAPNPFMRFLRRAERKFKKRAKKPTSKYHVMRRLRERLDATGGRPA